MMKLPLGYVLCCIALTDTALCQLHSGVFRTQLAGSIGNSLLSSNINAPRGHFVPSSRSGPLSRASIEGALSSYTCPRQNGFSCNANGLCLGGICVCYIGYTGSSCEVSLNVQPPIATGSYFSTAATTSAVPQTTMAACLSGNDAVCNGRGTCQNNVCVCTDGWSGKMCELSGSQGFCTTYRACAECKAIMETCPTECRALATFDLVFDFPRGASSFHKCRAYNTKYRCAFYYLLDGVSSTGMKIILVKACISRLVIDSETTPAFTTDVYAGTTTMMETTTGETQNDITSMTTLSKHVTYTQTDKVRTTTEVDDGVDANRNVTKVADKEKKADEDNDGVRGKPDEFGQPGGNACQTKQTLYFTCVAFFISLLFCCIR